LFLSTIILREALLSFVCQTGRHYALFRPPTLLFKVTDYLLETVEKAKDRGVVELTVAHEAHSVAELFRRLQ
jgi:hypothetical protein